MMHSKKDVQKCGARKAQESAQNAYALGEKVDELKSGRGAVLETGHLLVLGWSERVFSLLEQLALGCELSGGST
eukprot:scaffold238144_cov18-Tisochrysis_lutea.AAC.3